jgi:hypothetical protein
MFDQPYIYYSSKYTPPLGHTQLDIFLSKYPTQRYFDTRLVRLPLERSGSIESINIEHPWEEWLGSSDLHVCAGRITMINHHDKAHYAFSMGGSLSIHNQEEYTICKLVSSAPIFNLQDHLAVNIETTTGILVENLEELFAIRQAHWLSDESTYFSRLIACEPLTLFVALLAALEEKYAGFPISNRSERVRLAAQTVHHTIELLKNNGDWPHDVPDLDEIL